MPKLSSLERDTFWMIGEDHYSRFPYSTREQRVTSLLYMSNGAEKEKVREAIRKLVNIGLVKCIHRSGPAHWDVAYCKDTTAELTPTKFALFLMKKHELEQFFKEKGLD